MRSLPAFLFGALVLGTAAPTHAAPANPISVHVLDLQTGQPSPGIRVDLERRQASGQWSAVGSGRTDAQGRIRALVPDAALAQWTAGDYRVVFRTGEFYAGRQQASFFPEIPVVVRIDDATQHYHVPLLLSPFGFSTYRGN
jgi:5-hydroxyisourate hydrolase